MFYPGFHPSLLDRAFTAHDFSIQLGWFPIGLSVPIGKLASEVTLGERIHHLILPAFTLSITGIANIALHTRQRFLGTDTPSWLAVCL
ncbi:MAG: hypothetical protein LBK43_04320 [Treponema sp.]|nr:hypothetical protein [Treponema sp.]